MFWQETYAFSVFFSVLIVNISSANIVLTICDNSISLHINTGFVSVLNKFTPLFMVLDCEVMPSTLAFHTFMPSVLNNSLVSTRYLAVSNTFLGLTFLN